MIVKIDGCEYEVPSWTKAIVEDMQGRYFCLDSIPKSMYERSLCPLFPPQRIYKRIVMIVDENKERETKVKGGAR